MASVGYYTSTSFLLCFLFTAIIADDNSSLNFNRKIQEGENEHHTHPVNGERAWNIVREVLDRVFGSGENIRNEGWISHITNFLKTIGNAITTAIGGATDSGNGVSSSITTPDTPTEVETFNPNDLDIRDNEIDKRKLQQPKDEYYLG